MIIGKLGEEEMNAVLERYRYGVFLVTALALAGAVGYGLANRPPDVTLEVLPPPPTPLPTLTPSAAPVRVHVVGPVNAPGVYTLPPGALVGDAVQAAGGATDEADLARLNLAAVLQDQQQVVVPSQQAGGAPGAMGGGLVNINTASSEALQTLPGVGPATAEKIIAYREENGPFVVIDDIINVKGIGEATLEKLRPLITVGP
jgi:competence protein ComEA